VALVAPGQPVYDVLLDDYEKGMTVARLEAVFQQARARLLLLPTLFCVCFESAFALFAGFRATAVVWRGAVRGRC
jgi:hypothetical protein